MGLGDLFPSSPPSVRLDGGALYLRPPLRTDWAAWKQLRQGSAGFLKPWEPSWNDDLFDRTGFNRRVARAALDWRDGLAYPLFLFRAPDHVLLGGITLGHVRHGAASAATLGYWIGEPFARQGYMTHGLALTLDYAFDALGLHRIEAACMAHNEASRRLLTRAGFREEGLARKYLLIDGIWQDHLLYGLVREYRDGK